ncbi:hypothetical protein HanIR_Chr10g0461881 [Helianthus annuus]|nr:hypothetical protein HanIR_Chr10g0461881 [Helianthus annuus]
MNWIHNFIFWVVVECCHQKLEKGKTYLVEMLLYLVRGVGAVRNGLPITH